MHIGHLSTIFGGTCYDSLVPVPVLGDHEGMHIGHLSIFGGACYDSLVPVPNST